MAKRSAAITSVESAITLIEDLDLDSVKKDDGKLGISYQYACRSIDALNKLKDALTRSPDWD